MLRIVAEHDPVSDRGTLTSMSLPVDATTLRRLCLGRTRSASRVAPTDPIVAKTSRGREREGTGSGVPRRHV